MRDVVVVHLNRLVTVGRAPGRVQQGDVVGVSELLRGCSCKLAETYGEHGRAQRVLERLPRAEVGGERQGADDLGSADRPLAGRQHCRGRPRILRRHVSILRPDERDYRAEASSPPPAQADRPPWRGTSPARQ
jgi:hypothetical protein